MKIDESLQIFIESLPHLESLHYGFKLQESNEKGYCICSLAKCLTPWRKNYHIVYDHSVCGARHFQGPSLVQHFRMNITQQLPFILQHCLKREWD
jgi:hypothetical protein